MVEISNYWRLARELTVIQAVCLVAGIDPDSSDGVYCENWRADERPKGYNAVKAAITHAILSGDLSATIRREAWGRGWDEEPEHGQSFTKNITLASDDGSFDAAMLVERGLIYHNNPDWTITTVKVSTLKKWLADLGVSNGFFFPDGSTKSNTPDYLNQNHPRYAPRLAAAIKVWLAMEDENLRKGKSPKQAMEQWLESRYSELRLIQKNDSQKHGFRAGDINKSAIQEAAKIANWNDDGGTPPTPSK